MAYTLHSEEQMYCAGIWEHGNDRDYVLMHVKNEHKNKY